MEYASGHQSPVTGSVGQMIKKIVRVWDTLDWPQPQMMLRSMPWRELQHHLHYSDVIMSAMAPQITVSIVYSTACSGADQRKHQSSAPLAFVRGIHRWPMNFPHKGPVTRKTFSNSIWWRLHVYISLASGYKHMHICHQHATDKIFNTIGSILYTALQKSGITWVTGGIPE